MWTMAANEAIPLDVYVDGKKVGRTPVWLRQVEAAKHNLQIGGIETSVQVKKGKTVKIGFFKEALVKLPEENKRAASSESTKKRESRSPSPQKESKKQKRDDLTIWQRYVNGSMRHF